MAVSTDKDKIEELLTRGVENIYPDRKFLEKRLASEEQLTLYTGYDPTASTLHIGHGITMMKLRQFQDLGHKIIFLIGDFTGMIGDPTDKTSARQQLSREEVLENAKGYQKQAESILDFKGKNKVEIRYNSEWSDKMTLKDAVELASHFTVQQMLDRDMFKRRLKEDKPIHFHEFMYPLLQGHDSVAMDVDGEVGGNDQMFNMMAGRTLMKALNNKEKFVVTTKLLADVTTGKKMSKSEGNMIALSDTPEDMFGKVMSWPDEMIVVGFELCTSVPMSEVKGMSKELKGGVNPRDLKLRLAYELTNSFLGEDAAKKGQDHFASVIQGKDKPEDMDEYSGAGKDLLTVLVDSELCKSKSQARRDIDGGGVRVDDEKVSSYDVELKAGNVIQKGKRHFLKIK
jgi:tyrosyl-tRNA synthetase